MDGRVKPGDDDPLEKDHHFVAFQRVKAASRSAIGVIDILKAGVEAHGGPGVVPRRGGARRGSSVYTGPFRPRFRLPDGSLTPCRVSQSSAPGMAAHVLRAPSA